MNYFPAIAEKIQKDPSVLKMAKATLRKWRRLGEAPEARLDEWRRILEYAGKSPKGRKALIVMLKTRNKDNCRLLDFAPFAGILTREERRKVFLKCVYAH